MCYWLIAYSPCLGMYGCTISASDHFPTYLIVLPSTYDLVVHIYRCVFQIYN